MIGTRARHSLSQLLELQETSFVLVLLSKYNISVSISGGMLLNILSSMRALEDRAILQAISEIEETAGDLRARVNPKYRFDERMHDLAQCLLLDGYTIAESARVC